MKKKNKLFAFSLIELMISLIAISVIVAAFTPVISKRLKSGEISITQGGSSIEECSPEFFEGKEKQCCAACTKDKEGKE